MIGYSAMHKRLEAARGKAADHACVACSAPAKDWALASQVDTQRDDRGRVYSLDPDAYVPMCRPCHGQADFGRSVCHRGHPLTGDNLIQSNPRRACATCKREHDTVVRRAAAALGLSKRAFITIHGARRAPAEAVLDALVVRRSA